MADRKVARVVLDGTSRAKIASGAQTVFTNFANTAHEGSITFRGNAVVQGARTVFVENKPIARSGDIVVREGAILDGSTNVFASDILGAALDPVTVTTVRSKVDRYIESPQLFRNPAAAANEVKEYYQPIVEIVNNESRLAVDSAIDLIPWLQQRLDEASQGQWRETGQDGKPSNPNILNIWKELGFSNTSPWNTDQTPWCAGFANYALKSCGYRWAPEASSYAFRNNPTRWNFELIKIQDAQPGDIVSWNFGHISFIWQILDGKYSFVGGNQRPKSKTPPPKANDGDLTIAWGGEDGTTPLWSPTKGGINAILRPSKA